jgi:DNA-binding NtrC family response regulator
VNIIASTNKDLESMVEKGTFRRDLYHRLKVVHFDIPPLRKRSEEIPMLAEFFLKQLSVKYAVQKILTEEAMKALEKYDWPGNIRELQNTIESAYVTSTGTIVDAHELNKEILEPSKTKPIIMKTSKIGPEKTEKLNIIAALKACHGKITKAAKLLNISRQTLYRKIPEYSISISRYRR